MSSAVAAPKSFERHLDDTPFTRTQRKVWILSAMGVLLDGFDFFIIGVALIAFHFHLSPTIKGLVAVSAVAGAFLHLRDHPHPFRFPSRPLRLDLHDPSVPLA